MQFEDSLGDDGLETAEVKFVFFEEGVYCAKYQEFAEDREGVWVSGSVAPYVLTWEVIMDNPLVSSDWNDFGRFYIPEKLPKKCPTLF